MTSTRLPGLLSTIAVATTMALYAGSAKSFECITCAKEWTQVDNGLILKAQQAELVKQGATLAEQLKTLANQLAVQKDQLTDMKSNSQDLPTKTYTEVSTATLEQLLKTMQQASALDFQYDQLNAEFDRLYPGYSRVEMKNANHEATKYKGISDSVRDTLKNALTTMGLEASQFSTEQKTLDAIRSMMAAPASRMRAIQIGNLIAYEAATQTQKLRALMMAQMQAQTAYMASQQEDRDYQRIVRAGMFIKPAPEEVKEKSAAKKLAGTGNGSTTFFTPGEMTSFKPDFLKFDSKGNLAGIDPEKLFKFDPKTGAISSSVPGWKLSGDLYQGKITANGPLGAYVTVDATTLKVIGSSGINPGESGKGALAGFVVDGLKKTTTVTAEGKTTSQKWDATATASTTPAPAKQPDSKVASNDKKPADDKTASTPPASAKQEDSKTASNDKKPADDKTVAEKKDGSGNPGESKASEAIAGNSASKDGSSAYLASM